MFSRKKENKVVERQMKFTKSEIKRMLLEESETDEALLNAIRSLSGKIEELDISIDYLAASVTGEDPSSLGLAQKSLGRFKSTPRGLRLKDISEVEIKEIISQELESMLDEEKTKNKYAICTVSIGKTEGTQERSEWSKDAIRRYERCKAELDENM
tara:strand:+ start:372 stop:839 length:468 start_codon:yes stop_codon:yes gene_type:complete